MRRVLAATTALALLSVPIRAEELRTLRYTHRDAASALAWQRHVRTQLALQLRLPTHTPLPFDTVAVTHEQLDGYTRDTIRIRSTPGRFITCALAKPSPMPNEPAPAVVCIHGHQGTEFTPFDPKAGIYKEFGAALARRGFVVISTNVGQHEVYETGRTLMGERLWDLMRCVDYLCSLPDVAPNRIGCAGLSLGGEMAMWLAAIDDRVTATVSAGFLTYMEQMEHNHCMCWKFEGLRERVDFPDIYSLTAPRALQCQNGLKEPETQFIVPLAREAMDEVQVIYADMNAKDHVELLVHDGGHEIALDPLLSFLSARLKPAAAPAPK